MSSNIIIDTFNFLFVHVEQNSTVKRTLFEDFIFNMVCMCEREREGDVSGLVIIWPQFCNDFLTKIFLY